MAADQGSDFFAELVASFPCQHQKGSAKARSTSLIRRWVDRRRCLMWHLSMFGASFWCWLVDLALELRYLADTFSTRGGEAAAEGDGEEQTSTYVCCVFS